MGLSKGIKPTQGQGPREAILGVGLQRAASFVLPVASKPLDLARQQLLRVTALHWNVLERAAPSAEPPCSPRITSKTGQITALAFATVRFAP